MPHDILRPPAPFAAFVDLLRAAAQPLVRQADISYGKIARRKIIATAALAEPVDAIRDRFETEGKVDFSIIVALDGARGPRVAKMAVQWTLSRAPQLEA